MHAAAATLLLANSTANRIKQLSNSSLSYIIPYSTGLLPSAVQGTVVLGSQRVAEVPSLTVTSSTSGDSKRT